MPPEPMKAVSEAELKNIESAHSLLCQYLSKPPGVRYDSWCDTCVLVAEVRRLRSVVKYVAEDFHDDKCSWKKMQTGKCRCHVRVARTALGEGEKG